MAVRIRLKRLGRRNRAFWRICATDQRAARDGRVIEELGSYDPQARNEEKIRVDRERVSHWLKQGAQPSETVASLLGHVGIDRKGNEVKPKPWRGKKAPPPPAAKRVAEAKAAEAAAEPAPPAEAPAEPKAEAAPAPEAAAPAEAPAPAPEAEMPAEAAAPAPEAPAPEAPAPEAEKPAEAEGEKPAEGAQA